MQSGRIEDAAFVSKHGYCRHQRQRLRAPLLSGGHHQPANDRRFKSNKVASAAKSRRRASG